jgi:AcrR family transcriptional regulator
MSPRPRKVSDEAVFTAAMRVMARASPAQLTLKDIGAEAGITAGALVQRFGSRRGLLLTMFERLAESTPSQLEAHRASHASPLGALRGYAGCMAEMASSPAMLAHHLSYLQLDLTDEDFRKCAGRQARATRDAYRTWLDEAVAAGELRRGTDTAELARLVEVTLSGSLMTWAFYQETTATEWMRQDLERVLEPFLAASIGKRTPPR